MRAAIRLTVTVALVWAIVCPIIGAEAPAQTAFTHTETGTLCAKEDTKCAKLGSFALMPGGNLAVCDVGKAVFKMVNGRRRASLPTTGVLKIVTPDNKLKGKVDLDFRIVAAHAHSDKLIYVGGHGKIAKIVMAGKSGKSGEVTKELDFAKIKMPRAYVASITTTKKELFAAVEYEGGFGVYRFDHNFGSPKKIITDLRGCNHQLDITAYNGEILVAENTRHRVVRYDREGKQLGTFGKRDRTSRKSFGGCCNPMNLAVGSDGNVYTAESGTGLIKKFSLDGGYLGLVAKTAAGAGHKHVRVAVTADGNTIYIVDVTKNLIRVVNKAKAAEAKSAKSAKTGKGK